jgi:hypothetical protein
VRLTLFAESYDRTFDLPEGQVAVMADIFVFGDLVELRDLSVYPVGEDVLSIGSEQVRQIYRKIEDYARQAGFTRLRITGERLSGASRGRMVRFERRL